MTHSDNNRRPVNAKKKGKRDRLATRAAANSSQATSVTSPLTAASSDASTATPALDWTFLQSFLHPDDGDGQRPRVGVDRTNEYTSYKKSTQRFKDLLQSLVPPEIFASGTVSALIEATDYIVKEQLEFDDGLVNDLKYSIRIRKRVAQKHGGGDEGHLYFIEVLEYCWSFLAPRRKRHRPAVTHSFTDQESLEPSLRNRFQGLSTELDTEEDLDDEDDLPQTPQKRPEVPGPAEWTLDQLIKGTDRHNAMFFLYTIHNLMELCTWHFTRLNDMSVQARERKITSSALTVVMMHASVAANQAIEQVVSLEQTFNREYPHLNTVYRFFANLALGDMVGYLLQLVAEKSPLASQFSEKHAVEFLGDAMERGYRRPLAVNNKDDSLVNDFLERWQFRDNKAINVIMRGGEAVPSTVQQLFDVVQTHAKLEAPLKVDMLNAKLKHYVSNGFSSHSWIPCDFIGDNRSILHTIRLLQFFSGYVEELRLGDSIMRPGSFGICWQDIPKPATRIQVDMDELLMCSVLPALVRLCRGDTISPGLLHQDQLLTGFVQIKAFVDHPDLPVSWALAFTVHTVLTSIFEIQDPDNFSFLATTARTTFETFFEQLEKADEMRRSNIALPLCSPSWDRGVQYLRYLTRLVQIPMQNAQSTAHALLSVWNPFFAGASLSYLAFSGNLYAGTMIVDSDAQLRATLHLFNALQQLQVVRPGQIALLDRIFEVFKGCKVIWEGQIPVMGQFQNRWYNTFGLKTGGTGLRSGRSKSSSQGKPRLWAELFSASYCRICLQDFQGDGRQTGEMNRRKNHDLFEMIKMRVNNTFFAMSDDEPLLATNLMSLGYILNRFYAMLFIELGWMSLAESMANQAPQREESEDDSLLYQSMSIVFAEKILRPLDAGDASVASQCANLMDEYYNQISPDDFLWFSQKEGSVIDGHIKLLRELFDAEERTSR